jgi:hypothetical protein
MGIHSTIKIYTIVFLVCTGIAYSQIEQTDHSVSPISLDKLVGNVYGTVVDKITLKPINRAKIYLFDEKMQNMLNQISSTGIISQPLDTSLAVRSGMTNKDGSFLINFVPVPFPFRYYSITVMVDNCKPFIIRDVKVFPGAAMALKIVCSLEKGKEQEATIFSAGSEQAFVKYRDQEIQTVQNKSRQKSQGINGIMYTVYATREGLVGGTTANGHVIASHDHFVALPSPRVLCSNGGSEFQVKLTYNTKIVTAPIWDIGPWNVNDDYWNNANVRQAWNDLPRGMPEARAAFLDGYNNGKDGSGRTVMNSAGIDLADGTFWDSLGMSDNSWIMVDFTWSPDVNIGDNVQTLSNLNVRSSPASDTIIGIEAAGGIGTIIDGPQGAIFNNTFYVWWRIQWEGGLIGWSVENYLQKSTVGVADSYRDIPKSFELYQNYPNPFNPSTVIRYMLQTKSFIILQIYNMLGERVDELVNCVQGAGFHEVTWHTGIATGTYFYRMEAVACDNSQRRFVETKKLVLAK